MTPIKKDPGAPAPGPQKHYIGEPSNTTAPDGFGQGPLLSYMSLVAANARGYLCGLTEAIAACTLALDSLDPEGFALARGRFITAARGFSDITRGLVEPRILAFETADRLEREAASLQRRAAAIRLAGRDAR